MVDKPKPEVLYKFRSWDDDYHKTLLTEGKLWVPPASDLNDPFDCCIPPRYDKMDLVDLELRFLRVMPAEYDNYSPEQRLEIVRSKINELGLQDPDRVVEVLGGFAKRIQRHHGVLSFASVKENPLLWSHYADSYKGFCVGMLREKLESTLHAFFNKKGIAFQDDWIKYEEKMPVFIPTNVENDDFDQVVRRLTTKSDHWGYEVEYRYIFMGDGEYAIQFPQSAVSEIILGSEMSQTDRDEIIEIAKDKYPKAKILQAQRKPFEFELELPEIR